MQFSDREDGYTQPFPYGSEARHKVFCYPFHSKIEQTAKIH